LTVLALKLQINHGLKPWVNLNHVLKHVSEKGTFYDLNPV
jgi:hypothetical protein